jgi:hypothetical protein
MIWDVKIFLAKIKDGKGKDYMFLNKKSLLTITRPEIHILDTLNTLLFELYCTKSVYENEGICG